MWGWEKYDELNFGHVEFEMSAVKASFEGMQPGLLPYTQKGSAFGLMLCCYCLEIHNKF